MWSGGGPPYKVEPAGHGGSSVHHASSWLALAVLSAGGANNNDLPPRSSYRAVTPAALTIRYRDGQLDIEPWAIDYESYNDPERMVVRKYDPRVRRHVDFKEER